MVLQLLHRHGSDQGPCPRLVALHQPHLRAPRDHRLLLLEPPVEAEVEGLLRVGRAAMPPDRRQVAYGLTLEHHPVTAIDAVGP